MFTQEELKWLSSVLDQIPVQGIPNKIHALNILVKIQQMLQPPAPTPEDEDND